MSSPELLGIIDAYLVLPDRFQDPELVAIFTEYRSNLLRIEELSDQLRQHGLRLMSTMPAANQRPA